MKTNYKCDNKLKIYEPVNTYEQNLKKAKKLYLPHLSKKTTKNKYGIKSKLYQSGNKMNIGAMLKQYGNNFEKMTKKQAFKIEKEEPNTEEDIEEQNEENDLYLEEFEEKKRRIMDVFEEHFTKEEDNEQCDLANIVKRVKKGECYLKNKHNEKDYEMRLKGETPEDEEEEEEENEYNEDFEKESIHKSNNTKSLYEVNEFKAICINDVLKYKNSSKDNEEIKQLTYNQNVVNSKYETAYNIKKDDENNKNENNEEEDEYYSKFDDDDNNNVESVIKSQSHNSKNNKSSYHSQKSLHEESNITSFSVSENDLNQINRELFVDKNKSPSTSNKDERDIQVSKIQTRYRRYRDEKTQPKVSDKIYYGWNDNSIYSIFLYIYKEDYNNNVISFYSKIYSMNHQKMFIEVFTIPELKTLKIINESSITSNEARKKGKKLAMKILKVFYKVMENRKEQQKEEEINKSQSENKWMKYEEEFEMTQKSHTMDGFKDNVGKQVFEIEENSQIQENNNEVFEIEENSEIKEKRDDDKEEEDYYDDGFEQ